MIVRLAKLVMDYLATELGVILLVCNFFLIKSYLQKTVCGNGIIERGEECDTRESPSCCDSQCKLRSNGYICRNTTVPCDAAEYCNGTDQYLVTTCMCAWLHWPFKYIAHKTTGVQTENVVCTFVVSWKRKKIFP